MHFIFGLCILQDVAILLFVTMYSLELAASDRNKLGAANVYRGSLELLRAIGEIVHHSSEEKNVESVGN